MARSERPRRLVVIAGTGTEIGKTWVATRLAEAMADRSVIVSARKPAQSFDPSDGTTDADLLGRATGEQPSDVCPLHRWYPVPMAPPMAAESLDHEPLLLADLVAEVRESWPPRAVDLGMVELAGGPRSPMAHDGDGVDMIQMLVPDVVVLVADAGLGTINAVRQSVRDLKGIGIIVMLNRFDQDQELHRRNRDWLVGHDHLTVITDIGALAGMVSDLLPTFCMWTGVPAAEAPPRPLVDLEPPRFCPRCGRRLNVRIIPTGWTARCRDHGLIDTAL